MTVQQLAESCNGCDACTLPTDVIVRDVRIASVELQHVDAPVGHRLRVQLIVIQCARKSSTRATTNVLVNAELQAFRMYLF